MSCDFVSTNGSDEAVLAALACINGSSACVVLLPLQKKCSAPFGKDNPCRSCRKNGVDCVFSDRQNPGPKAKGATGVPSLPGEISVTQGGSAGRTVKESARAASGRARPASRLTRSCRHHARPASRVTNCLPTRRLAVDANSSDAAQTSVAGATANNSDRQKELRVEMHAIGDSLNARWVNFKGESWRVTDDLR
ncbi:unnamed protein product [Ectocarpus sp. CCAP 1310/34]|nr:unnamed protein product [Ectocarpus sp. CCAP 1310/34]